MCVPVLKHTEQFTTDYFTMWAKGLGGAKGNAFISVLVKIIILSNVFFQFIRHHSLHYDPYSSKYLQTTTNLTSPDDNGL